MYQKISKGLWYFRKIVGLMLVNGRIQMFSIQTGSSYPNYYQYYHYCC